MFPAFLTSQHEKQVVREAYITANRYIGSVSFPLMMWVIVTELQLIRVFYGPKWINAIPLVQILALTAVAQSISVIVGWMLLSQGRLIFTKVGQLFN
jgi:teichuronic acid exporter